MGAAGTDTQRMLFHAPEGASGTAVRGSIAAGVDVGVAVGAAVAVADGDADADAVSPGLAAGKTEAEPLEVTPTQPAANKAVSTSAAHLRHLRLLKNIDFTACPSGDRLCGNASGTPSWKAV